MPNELTYTATVDDNGAMNIINHNSFDQDIKSSFTGKKVSLKIKQYRKSRSNLQNSYYWGCLIPSVIDGLVDISFHITKSIQRSYMNS